MTVAGPSFVQLPVIVDRPHGGCLGFAEVGTHLPFEPKRAFYLCGFPPGTQRGGHAHRCDQQFLICLAGSFTLNVEHGGIKSVHRLTDPSRGLYAPPMTWLDIVFDAEGAVLLVLADLTYDATDYLRDYEDYRRAAVLSAQGC